ncbi:hypothetical protein IFU08_05800 [Microbacterium sp. CFBP 8790]|uniref:hypothetical protein n=1 Tax=unclassified Microbacterium TaxID=2609290 RepID=UPI001785DFB1|nr:MULTISPECIES: hypothetical protein [unclassified Microbacterium]MBD8207521.1 hypothetical protein [Microbacterium sp. CFBP 8801]MBD8509081.1 hypothetical protein [Microbacterium sp. CFBP 8790]
MLPQIDYTPLTHPTEPPARTDATAFAVSRLAATNGWEYFTHAVAQELPGVVFRQPNGQPRFSQRAVNIVRIPGAPVIEIGDSFYTEVAVGNQFTQQWGYVAVHLGVELPSVTVEAASNRTHAALPSTPEGAVSDDRRAGVVVEAAPGTEPIVDALLTSEITAALADAQYPLDAELTGPWLFLYAPRSLSTDDPASWEHLLRTVDLFVQRVREVVPTNSAVVSAPSGSSASSTPPPSAHTVSSIAPMQPRGSRVNGTRVRWYLLAVFGAMALAGGAALLFGGR